MCCMVHRLLSTVWVLTTIGVALLANAAYQVVLPTQPWAHRNRGAV